MDASRLTALSQLTRLAFGNEMEYEMEWGDAIGAIAQLTRLRTLELHCPPYMLGDEELASLSALSSLTSLVLTDLHRESTGGWLVALAAARVPLRELRLLDDAVVPGSGAEAAIGQLTRLTSLHVSVDRWRTALLDEEGPPNRQQSGDIIATAPLQLQLLGCGESTSSANGKDTALSSTSCGGAAMRNMGLQELTLESMGPLSDDELAAAAASLPDLRRLEITAPGDMLDMLLGLHGASLAAFSACRRLQHISLSGCDDLKAQQLAAQLPRISSLASLQLVECLQIDEAAVGELQRAFCAQHGRHLSVEL